MPENDDNETVADILKRKLGKIRQAPLEPGSPSWDDILGGNMEKHQTKGQSPKAGLPDVPETADRRSVRQKMKPEPFAKLMAIIRVLEEAQIHFTLSYHRYDAVSIHATVPGERWEIDVLEDGDVDFERFVSQGGVTGEVEMNEFIARFAEPAPEDRG